MIRTRKEVREVEHIEAAECDRCMRQVRVDGEGWEDGARSSLGWIPIKASAIRSSWVRW